MENKINCFGHKNRLSVRIGSGSAPSHLPHFCFGLTAGERRLSRGRQQRGLRTVVHPHIDTMPLRGDLELHSPCCILTCTCPCVWQGTACISLCCSYLSSPPKSRLSLVAFPGGRGLPCICVCAVPCDNSFIKRR